VAVFEIQTRSALRRIRECSISGIQSPIFDAIEKIDLAKADNRP
jgi:hypothetical protein